MNVIGAGDDQGVELTAGGVAVLRGVDILEKDELGGCVIGNVEEGTGDALGVVVDSVDGEVVVAGTLAADGGAGACSEAARAGDAGGEERKIENAKADAGGGQILDLLHGEGVGDLSRGGVDGDVGLAGDFDSRGALSDGEDDVLRFNAGGGNDDAVDRGWGEPGDDGAKVVCALRQVGDAVLAVLVGLAGVDDAGGLVGGVHGCVRNDSSGGVMNDADQGSARCLGIGDGCADQQDHSKNECGRNSS